MNTKTNVYVNKIRAIKLKLVQSVKEKENQRNLINDVWGSPISNSK